MTPPYNRQQHANYLINKAYDTIVWMSGSNDFSPNGIAAKGWEQARQILDEIQRYKDGQ